MKKLVCVLLILVLCIGATFALTACDKGAPVGDTIDFGAKYSTTTHTYESDYFGYTETSYSYYIFNKDGSGIYTDYHYQDYFDENEKDIIMHYSINFKYEYIDSDKTTVALFYDSITYHDDHNEDTDDYSTWKNILTVSKSVLISINSATANRYYNVEYLKNQYPNFNLNKPKEN